MATTMYLETTLKDKGGRSEPIEFEAGTSSFYGGIPRLYLIIDGHTVILDDKASKEVCDAFARIAAYLGYDGAA